MDEPEVLLDRVTKRFARRRSDPAAHVALEGVSLSVRRGELMVVVGPSGCGKSTALRIVAGLEQPDEGSVAIAGRPMAGVPPQDRDVAMVFQGYALYPHMTAREILEFPLRMRGVPRQERAAAVRDAAAILRIEPLLDRHPGELSGGERQRVAMGRAIVRKARVFLFDEPLSNLDAALRGDIRLEIGQLVRRLGTTAVYVTHDHVEAMTLADRIAVMARGRVCQVGSPREVYERPATSFVATFLGTPRMNVIRGRTDGDRIAAGPFYVPRPKGSLPDRVDVGVRPEHVSVAKGDSTAPISGASGRVLAVEPIGSETHLLVRTGDVEMRAVARGFGDLRRDDEVSVAIDNSHVHLFDGGDGRRIET
jgi:multiple sugar transport system ATP-binding protein